MGRHSAPEAQHRRGGSQIAQIALVAALAIAAGVLVGAILALGPTTSGTFAGSQTGEQAPPGVAAPEVSAEPSTAVSAPSSDQVSSPESRGKGATSAPMTSESASGSPDTTAPVVRFVSCTEAKAAGVSMIPRSDPRYSAKLDRDGDGMACDRHGDPPTRYKPPPTVPPCTCTCPR